MAKKRYALPVSLDRNFMDHEIRLELGGFIARPMPIKQILVMVVLSAVTLWAVMSTGLKTAGLGWNVLFVAWGLTMAAYLSSLTPTKDLRLLMVPVLAAYLPPAARNVSTRRFDAPTPFYGICTIRAIAEDGTVEFTDNGFGRFYHVVGSASYLLFDEDRDAILDRVDAFWRKIDPGVEVAVVTTREPQRVWHQVRYLEERNQRLSVRDSDLLDLQDEQYDVLVHHVGGRYASIRQYVLVRTQSADALRRGHLLITAEADQSSLMFKELHSLDRSETEIVLQILYRGVETESLGDRLDRTVV